jgi:hypothetical protein
MGRIENLQSSKIKSPQSIYYAEISYDKTKTLLVEVDINAVLNCKNKKHGCDLRAKQYTCYKRMRCKTNKSSPDKITLTNSRNKTKKIRPVIRVENVWYDCSHFTK